MLSNQQFKCSDYIYIFDTEQYMESDDPRNLLQNSGNHDSMDGSVSSKGSFSFNPQSSSQGAERPRYLTRHPSGSSDKGTV